MLENSSHNAPVLICGMHRSGTSLFAQMLSNCGLFLGEREDLLEAHSEDNPEGFWESKKIVNFTDELLKKIGGAWDHPVPVKTVNWMDQIDLDTEQRSAIKLFQPLMNAGKPWGWKDPRGSIILPFWKSIFPDLRVIICLRNPLEVAYSLSKRFRTHIDFHQGLILWQDYYKILSRDMQDVDSIVTHYEAMLFTPEKELGRLCDFIKLTAPPEDQLRALNAINLDLYRGVATEQLLQNFPQLPPGLQVLYQHFSSLSGSNFAAARRKKLQDQNQNLIALEKTLSSATATFDHHAHFIQTFKNQVKEQEITFTEYKKEQKQLSNQLKTKLNENTQTKQKLTDQLNERKKTIQDLKTQITEQNQTINGLTDKMRERQQTIKNLKKELRKREQVINELSKQKSDLDQEVLYYTLSKSWRITRPFRKIRKYLLGIISHHSRTNSG